ncbi:hypothetical protein LDENG_00010280 [Lucifuga dentata]|nr:hypothetical protein LDENG_00010280 [Lucifuga dentata]
MEKHTHRIKQQCFKESVPFPEGTPKVEGYDFNCGVDHRALLQSYVRMGFQATRVGLAIQEINKMIERRQQPVEAVDRNDKDSSLPSSNSDKMYDIPPLDIISPCPCRTGCTIFLGYTSNQITCGVRETIRYLAEHKMVDVLVTTAGGIEEDLMKCLAPVFIGDFEMLGKNLYQNGINRSGNVLLPNDSYDMFEKWMMPILKQMHVEQNTQGVRWTPSKMINRLGKEINNPESVYYWAYKNNIPVFCPALTDGAVGDALYLYSTENPGLILDIVEDVFTLNNIALVANCTGMIILGGGVAKHHICNTNAWRDGAEYAVYVNTGQEFDGSDSGARPDEAVSWGKIHVAAKPVKVFADASIIFPLLVAETFAVHAEKMTACKKCGVE